MEVPVSSRFYPVRHKGAEAALGHDKVQHKLSASVSRRRHLPLTPKAQLREFKKRLVLDAASQLDT